MTSITVEIPSSSVLKKVITFFKTLNLSFHIEKKALEVRDNNATPALPPGCGAWEDEREPDEIIADIRAARYFMPEKENFSL